MKRVISTFLVSSFFLAASIASASAHTALLSSSPKAGSIVASWPSKISLTFNESLLIIAGKSVNSISVKDSAGHRFDQGAAAVGGASVAVATRNSTQSGKFTVQYRVVSADGHPVTGKFTFTFKK